MLHGDLGNTFFEKTKEHGKIVTAVKANKFETAMTTLAPGSKANAKLDP